MSRKRSSSSVVAALTLLCLPHALVAAFNVYDYMPSSFGSGGGSLVRRADVPEAGYYDPLDYGGYMLTVSFHPSLPSFTVSGGLSLVPPPPGYGCLFVWDHIKSSG